MGEVPIEKRIEGMIDDYFQKVGVIIKDALAESRKPIPTAERLPNVGARVLVWVKMNVTYDWEFATLTSGEQQRWESEVSIDMRHYVSFPLHDVEYWLLLPPPPEPHREGG